MMKVYVLDWGGTLDQIYGADDPYNFVKALQARGDFVVFYSGGYAGGPYSKGQFALVERACNYSLSKCNFTELLRSFSGKPDMYGITETPPNGLDPKLVTEVVVSDDNFPHDKLNMMFYADLAGVPVRYVDPVDLIKEARP